MFTEELPDMDFPESCTVDCAVDGLFADNPADILRAYHTGQDHMGDESLFMCQPHVARKGLVQFLRSGWSRMQGEQGAGVSPAGTR
jgi:hypothetical protein